MQANAAIRKRCAGTIFYVAQNGHAGFGKLCPYLVKPSGFQVNFQQKSLDGLLQVLVVKYGLFGSCLGFEVGEGSVGFAVFSQVMNKFILVCWWFFCYQCPVGFDGAFAAKLFIHAGQGFGGSGQKYNAAYGPVQAVYESYKGLSGFVVFVGKVIRNHIQQVHIAGAVALRGKTCGFVHRNQVVVFIKHFQLHVAKVGVWR